MLSLRENIQNYFGCIDKKIANLIDELTSDFHLFTETLIENAKIHYTRQTDQQMSSLNEGFADKL